MPSKLLQAYKVLSSTVLQGCMRGPAGQLQGCCRYALGLLQGCKAAAGVLHCCRDAALLQGCFRAAAGQDIAAKCWVIGKVSTPSEAIPTELILHAIIWFSQHWTGIFILGSTVNIKQFFGYKHLLWCYSYFNRHVQDDTFNWYPPKSLGTRFIHPVFECPSSKKTFCTRGYQLNSSPCSDWVIHINTVSQSVHRFFVKK